MYHNVGRGDRLLRLLFSIIFVFIGVFFYNQIHYLVAYVLVLLGILLFVTSVVSWCPVFSMFGYSSRRRGLDRIKMDDIQRAVKENAVPKSAPLKKVRATVAGSSKKVVKKKTPAKKKVVKKTTPAKKTTTKVVKKTAKKTPAKKKTAVKKKTPVKKK